jgi:hypothetical protein
MTSQPKPTQTSQRIHIVLPPRTSPMRRLGCFIVVIIWFAILLTPCLCFVLASQGEVAIQLGDVPGQSLRIWLLNESRQRGIGISRPSISTQGDLMCVQTDVSFFLWAGSAEGTIYCECYTQPDEEGWQFVSNNGGSCQP